jgi:phenylacetate-CoA ligase
MLATPELLQEAAQPDRLLAQVSRYVNEVPLYHDLKPKGLAASFPSSSSDLPTWPFITKADIRNGFPNNFLGTSADLEELLESEVLELEHTSGTSEERTALLLPKGWWAEQELRALNLNASVADVLHQHPNARRATINSPVCSGDIRYNGVPSRENRIVGNSLFVGLSRFPFLWGERELERIAKEILDWEPEFLDVDPVYAVVFALYCEQHRIQLPSLRFIVCSYEFVSLVHRAILERVFAVPILDLYGSTETGHLMMQDEQGLMRPSLETAFLEVVETDAHGISELVVTTLSNPIMPLIRYRIGDLVERSERPYGTRYTLHGRTADAFWISKETRISTRRVDQCFAGLIGFAHYQLIQRKDGTWLMRFVADNRGPQPGDTIELQKRLASLLHSSDPIELQRTDMLAPEQSGKFRLGYPQRVD